MTQEPIHIFILAGGKSTRMGQDKGLMKFQGKAMIEHVMNTAMEISEAMSIITHNDKYAQFGKPVISDTVLAKGPIGGIYTGLLCSTANTNLFLSCDIPFLSIGVLERLFELHQKSAATVAQYYDQVHPLIGIYSKACLPIVENAVRENRLKLQDLLAELNAKKVIMNDFLPENFRNINSLSDL